MLWSVTTSTESDVLEHLFGKDVFNFHHEIIANVCASNAFYKGRDASVYLSIPGISRPYSITIKGITSDYPPKVISSSTNGDQFIKYRPVSIGQVATEVKFRLSDVTSRYMNSWIYLVFYVEADSEIKPYMIGEATVRAKKWRPKKPRTRNPQYSNQGFKSAFEDLKKI